MHYQVQAPIQLVISVTLKYTDYYFAFRITRKMLPRNTRRGGGGLPMRKQQCSSQFAHSQNVRFPEAPSLNRTLHYGAKMILSE